MQGSVKKMSGLEIPTASSIKRTFVKDIFTVAINLRTRRYGFTTKWTDICILNKMQKKITANKLAYIRGRGQHPQGAVL